MKYTSWYCCDKQWTTKWLYIANVVFRIVQNYGEKVAFIGFKGAIAPPGSAPASVFLVLFFTPARSHAAENRLSACWKACWKDASSTTPSEKSKRLIVQFPTPSSTRLWLSTAVVLTRGTSINFPLGASPYAPYNMESLIIKFTNKYICFYSLFEVMGAWNKRN